MPPVGRCILKLSPTYCSFCNLNILSSVTRKFFFVWLTPYMLAARSFFSPKTPARKSHLFFRQYRARLLNFLVVLPFFTYIQPSLGPHGRSLFVISSAVLLSFAYAPGKLGTIVSVTLMPLTIWIFSRIPITGKPASVCEWLGSVSYPVYMIHTPIYIFWFALTEDLGIARWGDLLLYTSLTFLVATLLLRPESRLRSLILQRING